MGNRDVGCLRANAPYAKIQVGRIAQLRLPVCLRHIQAIGATSLILGLGMGLKNVFLRRGEAIASLASTGTNNGVMIA